MSRRIVLSGTGYLLLSLAATTSLAQQPNGAQRLLPGARPAAGPAAGPAGPAGPAVAATSGRAPSAGELGGAGIAVLDVRKVFEDHKPFNAQLKAIEAEIKLLEEELAKKQKDFEAKQTQIRDTFKVGSPDLDREMEALARQLADARVDAGLQQKSILEKEAKLYYETFVDIERAVKRLCDHYGFQLVIRFDSRTMDINDRGSVMSAVNRSIVYQNGIDITSAIVQMTNPQQQQSTAARAR